jgi:hypothetical protein
LDFPWLGKCCVLFLLDLYIYFGFPLARLEWSYLLKSVRLPLHGPWYIYQILPVFARDGWLHSACQDHRCYPYSRRPCRYSLALALLPVSPYTDDNITQVQIYGWGGVRRPLSISPYSSFLHSYLYPCLVPSVHIQSSFVHSDIFALITLCWWPTTLSLVDDYVTMMTLPNLVTYTTSLSHSLVTYWSRPMWPYSIP